MAHLTLVVGGMRSGKSRFAEGLAAQSPPVTYLATALPGDVEMAGRIAAHRQRRPADWHTVEEPWELARVVADRLSPDLAASASPGCVLIECLALWLTNRMLGTTGRPGCADEEIRAELAALVAAVRIGNGRVVAVTSEAGCGIVPANALARRFGDLLGEANQALAAAATEVYLCVAGIPLRLK